MTLTSINTSASEIDLLLKSQSSSTYVNGVLEVWYDPINHRSRSGLIPRRKVGCSAARPFR